MRSDRWKNRGGKTLVWPALCLPLRRAAPLDGLSFHSRTQRASYTTGSGLRSRLSPIPQSHPWRASKTARSTNRMLRVLWGTDGTPFWQGAGWTCTALQLRRAPRAQAAIVAQDEPSRRPTHLRRRPHTVSVRASASRVRAKSSGYVTSAEVAPAIDLGWFGRRRRGFGRAWVRSSRGTTGGRASSSGERQRGGSPGLRPTEA